MGRQGGYIQEDAQAQPLRLFLLKVPPEYATPCHPATPSLPVRYGVSVQMLKIEVRAGGWGAERPVDGTEPSHMHLEGQAPDCSAGYEWWLVKEAKARNGRVAVYALPRGFPL